MYDAETCRGCPGRERGWCGTGNCPVDQEGSWND